MRRRRLAKRGGLVEILKIFPNHFFAQNFFGQALGSAFKKTAKKIVVLVHPLDLFQRADIRLVFIKHVLHGQGRNALRDEPRQRGLEGLQSRRIAKTRHSHESILLECCFVIHGLGFIQSR